MFRKLILITLTYYIPLVYIPIYINGFVVNQNFFIILLISFVLAICLVIVTPMMNFLTLKSNIYIYLVISIILIYGSIYLLQLYSGLINITKSTIEIRKILGFDAFGHSAVALNSLETMLVSSLLMALWGIIIFKLAK